MISFRSGLSLLAFCSLSCASMLMENYFVDVENTVQPVWVSTVNEALKKQGLKKVPGPLETRVHVVVDPTGKVLDVRLGRSSGLGYINKASIETFRRVGKLPPPPSGMVTDGTAKLDWGFVIIE